MQNSKLTDKSKIIRRLRIAEGHLKKVREMLEKDAYCIDVLHQSQAVQAAIREIDSLILNNHLNTCVVDAIKKGRDKEVIEEIMAVFKKSRR
ncbi:metal-sensitive transcriptional regulator [Candidatus Gottesmanbacteria bacterium]|nr:metal-sensitive transcriptional regulator [Candidatus Gottesmanbacteria bacterium]MBI5451946.1 metal-sensitive transcriptional regulator [Candidatus Gottesmanbacteria bacterium]